jgi:hypothetical protein
MFFIADIDLAVSEFESFKEDNYIPVRIVLKGVPNVDVWLCGQIIQAQDRLLIKKAGIATNMYSYLREEATK